MAPPRSAGVGAAGTPTSPLLYSTVYQGKISIQVLIAFMSAQFFSFPSHQACQHSRGQPKTSGAIRASTSDL